MREGEDWESMAQGERAQRVLKMSSWMPGEMTLCGKGTDRTPEDKFGDGIREEGINITEPE